jgi:hypothetical protein
MLNVIYAECHKYALYAECRFAECGGALTFFWPAQHLHPENAHKIGLLGQLRASRSG